MYQEYFYFISDDFRKKHFNCDYGTPPKVVKIQQSRSIMILFGNHTLNSTGVSKFTWSTVLFCEYRSLINKGTLYNYQIRIPLSFQCICPFSRLKQLTYFYRWRVGKGYKHATFLLFMSIY